LSWTIWWDLHGHPGAAQWSKAAEGTSSDAMDRARRFVKLGFVVYQITDPDGGVFMDKAQISERFGRTSLREDAHMPHAIEWRCRPADAGDRG
jgi:hypothetical protein